jgi:chromosome segregation ATPase
MKYVLKALDNQLKLIKEDLDWHRNELRVYKDKSFEQRKEITSLREEKEVLMKVIEDLKNK